MANYSDFFACHLLEFTTDRGQKRSYYGTTQLLVGQTASEACAVRLKYHKTRPLKCLQKAVASSMSIEPLRTLQEKNALAQEALDTARALQGDLTVRGACWSGPYLSAPWRASAAAVRRAAAGLSGQQARQAVLKHAAMLPKDEPLCQHLAGEPFSGAKRPLQKLRAAKLSRASGTAGNVIRKRLRRTVKGFKGSDRERQLHRGKDPEARRTAENEKRQPLRRKRAA